MVSGEQPLTACQAIAMSAGPIDERAVFNIARRIDGREARADYPQQVCGADPEALQRVRELLQVHEQEQ
jgi:hypothetical protein